MKVLFLLFILFHNLESRIPFVKRTKKDSKMIRKLDLGADKKEEK